MSKPHVCPLCGGEGTRTVSRGTAVNTETCHACDGRGIVWEPDIVSAPSVREFPMEFGSDSSISVFPDDSITVWQ
jgi:hypothetical protein